MNRGHPEDWTESQIKIFEALEETRGATFSNLLEKTGLAKSTFNNNLKELENEGLINRKAVPPKGGKGRHKIIIEPAPHLLEPTERTLRHLVAIKAVNPPSLEEGRELLRKNVKEIIFDIATLRWSDDEEEFEVGRELWKRILLRMEDGTEYLADDIYEFNEFWFIRGLARYYTEWDLIHAISTGNSRWFRTLHGEESEDDYKKYFLMFEDLLPFNNQEELENFYRQNSDNPDVFRASSIAEESSVIDELVGLIEWISPLLSVPHLRIEMDSGRNLVSAVFEHERDKYLGDVLKPSFKHRLRSNQ